MFLALVTFFAMAETNLETQLSERRAQAKNMPVATKKIMSEATKKLQDSGQVKKAMRLNAKLPEFTFFDKGVQHKISEFYGKKPLVIHFYRGSWCPYCMLELKAYETLKKDFAKAGIEVMHFTPDREKEITTTKKKHKLSGKIISDKDNKIATQLGIAFQLDQNIQKIYKEFGIDLNQQQGNDKQELPMPAVYIVDKDGIIRYAFIDADYTKRAEPKTVLEEAKKWL